MGAMGEPSADYKAKVQAIMLADKVKKAESEKKRKAQDQGDRDRARRRVDEEGKAAEGEEKKPEEEAPEEDKPIELTEEEKSQWHRKPLVPDVTKSALQKVFATFSLPGDEEGFDEVRYVWQGAEGSASLFKEWLLEQ